MTKIPPKPDAALGRHKISRALVELACSHVFHASIIMRLRRVEDTSMPFLMGTDGTRLLVNPEYCSTVGIAELTGVLAHEAIHVAGRHPFRRGGREAMLWNIACDAVVNDSVQSSNLKLPEGCVPAVKDETPEHLYQKPPKSLKNFAGKLFDSLFEPRNPDGSKMSKAQQAAAEQECKQWVEAAASAAKRAGQLDAGLERFVKRELRSVVHWKEVLARFVTEKRVSDYTWQRPNKRYTAFDVYLPKLEAQDIPSVAIACDTSGSISPKMIEEVVAEVVGILEMMSEGTPVEIPVLWFDHSVYPQIVSDADELKVQGGGGTAYAPVMAWMSEHGGDYKGLVVVTDGYCADFGAAPACDVLWVLTNEHAEDFRPPYGEVALVLDETN